MASLWPIQVSYKTTHGPGFWNSKGIAHSSKILVAYGAVDSIWNQGFNASQIPTVITHNNIKQGTYNWITCWNIVYQAASSHILLAAFSTSKLPPLLHSRRCWSSKTNNRCLIHNIIALTPTDTWTETCPCLTASSSAEFPNLSLNMNEISRLKQK